MTEMYLGTSAEERLEAENARLKEQVRRLREALMSILRDIDEEATDEELALLKETDDDS